MPYCFLQSSETATQRHPPVPKAKASSATNSKNGTTSTPTTTSARRSSGELFHHTELSQGKLITFYNDEKQVIDLQSLSLCA